MGESREITRLKNSAGPKTPHFFDSYIKFRMLRKGYGVNRIRVILNRQYAPGALKFVDVLHCFRCIF